LVPQAEFPLHVLGHGGLDEDHNALHQVFLWVRDACQRSASASEIGELVGLLVGAAEKHFENEERMMAESAFPFLTLHRHRHEVLLIVLRAIRDSLMAGVRRADNTLLHELWDWEDIHIRDSDSVFVQYLRAGSKGPPREP
jgi:hemerythrin-like metal-binding protein